MEKECKGKELSMDIKKVSESKILEIIETRQPKGIFYCLEQGMYIGVDNRDGNAWTDEFLYRNQCFSWLKDEEYEDIKESKTYDNELLEKIISQIIPTLDSKVISEMVWKILNCLHEDGYEISEKF